MCCVNIACSRYVCVCGMCVVFGILVVGRWYVWFFVVYVLCTWSMYSVCLWCFPVWCLCRVYLIDVICVLCACDMPFSVLYLWLCVVCVLCMFGIMCDVCGVCGTYATFVVCMCYMYGECMVYCGVCVWCMFGVFLVYMWYECV